MSWRCVHLQAVVLFAACFCLCVHCCAAHTRCERLCLRVHVWQGVHASAPSSLPALLLPRGCGAAAVRPSPECVCASVCIGLRHCLLQSRKLGAVYYHLVATCLVGLCSVSLWRPVRSCRGCSLTFLGLVSLVFCISSSTAAACCAFYYRRLCAGRTGLCLLAACVARCACCVSVCACSCRCGAQCIDSSAAILYASVQTAGSTAGL